MASAISPSSSQRPALRKEEAQQQLQALISAFPREEARRMKARAFWLARKRKKATRGGADAPPDTGDDGAVCPITLTPHSQLQHPCVASDGCIYESAALERWARVHSSSPISRSQLRFGVPLQAARRAISLVQ